MARQYFAEGIGVDERSEREYFAAGVGICETVATAPPGVFKFWLVLASRIFGGGLA